MLGDSFGKRRRGHGGGGGGGGRGSGGVPRRIKEAAKGDMRKQRDKHTAWLRWREEFDIANVFDTPKPAFEVIKAFYPHAFHKKTKGGFAIHLEMPGQFSTLLEELRKRGFDNPSRMVIEHISFVMCYAFKNIEPREFPEGRVLRVIDLSRMDSNDTTYEAFVFLKSMANLVSSAFPERVHKVVIVNPPTVFGLLWSIFSPMASQSTLDRVRICKTAEEARATLSEDIDARDIPREYGGECSCVECGGGGGDGDGDGGGRWGVGGGGGGGWLGGGGGDGSGGSWLGGGGGDGSGEGGSGGGSGGGGSGDGGGGGGGGGDNSSSRSRSSAGGRKSGGFGDCPSANCSDCWRYSELERDLWDKVRELNGGLKGVPGLPRRSPSSRSGRGGGAGGWAGGAFGGGGAAGVGAGGASGGGWDAGAGAGGGGGSSSLRRTRSTISESEASELSDSGKSWFW